MKEISLSKQFCEREMLLQRLFVWQCEIFCTSAMGMCTIAVHWQHLAHSKVPCLWRHDSKKPRCFSRWTEKSVENTCSKCTSSHFFQSLCGTANCWTRRTSQGDAPAFFSPYTKSGACGIRQKLPERYQMFQFGNSSVTKSDLYEIADQCIQRMLANDLAKEDAKDWCTQRFHSLNQGWFSIFSSISIYAQTPCKTAFAVQRIAVSLACGLVGGTLKVLGSSGSNLR